MRVIVDQELCEGNAVCMRVNPEVFVVRDDDKAHLLMTDPPESLRPRSRSRCSGVRGRRSRSKGDSSSHCSDGLDVEIFGRAGTGV